MLDELTERIVDFRDGATGSNSTRLGNCAASISIEAAELLELFQWSSDATLDADVEATARIFGTNSQTSSSTRFCWPTTHRR